MNLNSSISGKTDAGTISRYRNSLGGKAIASNIFCPVLFKIQGRRAYGPPDGEWLPSPMDFSNARGRAKPLPTAYFNLTEYVELGLDDL